MLYKYAGINVGSKTLNLVPGALDEVGRVIGADAGGDPGPVPDRADDRLDEGDLLLVGRRRRLAGRPADDDAVVAVVDEEHRTHSDALAEQLRGNGVPCEVAPAADKFGKQIRHAERRGARPPLWTFAAASPEELARLGPPLGLAYAPDGSGEFVHNLSTAVVGPDGRLVRLERGGDWSVDSLFPDVARAAGQPGS